MCTATPRRTSRRRSARERKRRDCGPRWRDATEEQSVTTKKGGRILAEELDLTQYRSSDSEVLRSSDLMRLVPQSGHSALDVGARDGYFSKLLADRYDRVTALDLEMPAITHRNVECVQGDITNLDFRDDSLDLVFCTEVLEHISPRLLGKACAELSRVSRDYVLIGVPYKQDTRVGRTTCASCGAKNPPWGHVNIFDESRLTALFPDLSVRQISFVGETAVRTNLLSTWLMDLAGNPYGTYQQEEPCVHCGSRLRPPDDDRTILERVSTRFATYLTAVQRPFTRTHGIWIHILFQKGRA